MIKYITCIQLLQPWSKVREKTEIKKSEPTDTVCLSLFEIFSSFFLSPLKMQAISSELGKARNKRYHRLNPQILIKLRENTEN